MERIEKPENVRPRVLAISLSHIVLEINLVMFFGFLMISILVLDEKTTMLMTLRPELLRHQDRDQWEVLQLVQSLLTQPALHRLGAPRDQ